MKTINELLKKFKKILGSAEKNKKTIIETINIIAKTDLEEKDVTVRAGIITIKASPAAKNEIFFKKTAIVGELKKQGINTSDIK